MGELKFRKSILFYMLPAFCIYSLFFVLPFAQTFYYSLFKWDGFGEPTFIGIANYFQLVTDELFTNGIGRVLIWAFMAILFKVGMALILANILRKAIRGSKFFTGVYFMPVVISSAALCLMFTLMYDKDIGIFNWILSAIGLEGLTRAWLGDQNTAFYAVLAVPIFHTIGYFFIILLAGIKNIPEEIYESAVIDGANAWTLFTRITVPLIWPVLQICIILAINGAMKSFDYVFIMTQGGPGTSTQVPATYMYDTIFTAFQFGYGTAIAFSIFIFTLSVVLVFRKLTNFGTH
ncbi:carbohydrate ABC transporter permease [Ammoniphilus sp. YIM 78166]|uniref:carbohydrate ABC transporter permease n=1 Tax=Ammoniphilus sp. YIM 78166 TaxID=1644106 RepID=UPI001431A68D|nr:sugar ABC transporter permease [Ammoniphilus sp. YIM 78166]